jgi:hypothetical protein
MFISKTICNKPYITNQKKKNLKKKQNAWNKEMEKRKKTLQKKYRFLILDSWPLLIPARRNAWG